MTRVFRSGLAAVAIAVGCGAQATSPLTLPAAVALAWVHYPSLAAAQAAAARATAEVNVAGVARLPVSGVAGQWDRATDNTTLGLSFPSPLPSISGTVPTSDYSGRGTWTSASGVYFAWEVLDFGRRAANIRYFRALAGAAADQAALVRLQVGAHAADACLTALAAGQRRQVAQADTARWQQLSQSVHALVDQQLRPGADASRVDAELAGARIRLIKAEQDLANADAALNEALGESAPGPVGALPAPPEGFPTTAALASHPVIQVQQQTLNSIVARQQELGRSSLPRWNLLGAAYGRGTGIETAGKFAGGWSGFAPGTAGNWALGLSLDFSFTRWRANQAESAATQAQAAQEQARMRQLRDGLELARQQAANDLTASRAVAQQSPIELEAAQAGERQAQVRYQNGLAGIVDLANAEQVLAQAESDQALAALQIWRALLESAYADGDLQPLLAAAGSGR